MGKERKGEGGYDHVTQQLDSIRFSPKCEDVWDSWAGANGDISSSPLLRWCVLSPGPTTSSLNNPRLRAYYLFIYPSGVRPRGYLNYLCTPACRTPADTPSFRSSPRTPADTPVCSMSVRTPADKAMHWKASGSNLRTIQVWGRS